MLKCLANLEGILNNMTISLHRTSMTIAIGCVARVHSVLLVPTLYLGHSPCESILCPK